LLKINEKQKHKLSTKLFTAQKETGRPKKKERKPIERTNKKQRQESPKQAK